jgi:hypothetical protein
VRLAPQLEVVGQRLTSDRVRHDVMKLQEPRLGASAVGADERALTTVARPDLTLHGGGDPTGPTPRLARGLRSRRPCELLPGEVVQEQRQRAIENRGDVAVRDRVPKDVLNLPQFFVGSPVTP